MLSWIARYSRGSRNGILTSVLAGGVRVVAMLLFVFASKRVVDIATGVRGEDSFLCWSVVMVLAIGVEIAMGVLVSLIEKNGSVRLQNSQRLYLFSHLLSVLWRGREQHHTGDKMNRMERDVKDVSEFISSQFPSFLVNLVQFFGAFVFLMVLDSRLAWLMVGILPLFLVVSKFWYSRMKRLNHQVRDSDSQVQSHIQENMTNRLVIKTHGASQEVVERLSVMQDTLQDKTFLQTRFSLYSRGILSAGFACGYLVTFIYGAWQLHEGVITYGVMVAFLQLVGQIQRPVSQLAGVIPQFTGASTAADRLDELRELETEEQGLQVVIESPCGVRFEGVGFRYDTQGREIYRDFSFDFPPCSRTVIVGETGAGKTTLFRLMLGLVKPDNGSIAIYNTQQSHQVSPLTRTNFVYVPQGNTLFSGTIRDNLLLGNPRATDEQMYSVLQTAVAEFVYELPLGLDTLCGEGGGVLSEGQAQRIAIARALLSGGSIMLFDEFSSALDSATESLLVERLIANYPTHCMIFITHRRTAFEAKGVRECVVYK